MNVEANQVARGTQPVAARSGDVFSRAIARARASPALLARPAPEAELLDGPAPVLRRRRMRADAGDATLERRRGEAKLTATPPPEAPRPCSCAAADPAASPTAPAAAGPLLSRAAVERVAIEARRLPSGSYVELAFGRDVRVLIAQASKGVEVVVDAPSRRAAAEWELPAIVQAIRARGVEVAFAGVRERLAPTGGAPRAAGGRPPSARAAASPPTR